VLLTAQEVLLALPGLGEMGYFGYGLSGGTKVENLTK